MYLKAATMVLYPKQNFDQTILKLNIRLWLKYFICQKNKKIFQNPVSQR